MKLTANSNAPKEWIVANKLGGYSSLTIQAQNLRKYHALLVAALSPFDRKVILSNVDEEAFVENERTELNIFEFNIGNPRMPSFSYFSSGLTLKKQIFVPAFKNEAVLRYEIFNPLEKNFKIALSPFLTFRGIHELLKNRNEIYTRIKSQKLNVFSDRAEARENDVWKKIEYAEERNRGYDYEEELYSPLKLTFETEKKEDAFFFTCSLNEEIDNKIYEFYEKEKQAIKKHENENIKLLSSAADSFIVKGNENETYVIAGYHWFSVWGRDTFISLPGLMLATKNFEDARKVFLTYLKYSTKESGYLLPNILSPLPYNSADASLWFIYAAFKYAEHADDFDFVRKNLLEKTKNMLFSYQNGTSIMKNNSGLIELLAPGLTWMDAKVGEHHITPRAGIPVEINALYYNALKIMEFFSKEFKEDARAYSKEAEKTKKAFEVFWNEKENCLYDVVGSSWKDASIRPNQIFAVSLPFRVLGKEKEKAIFDKVFSELYTPFGLRSLSPRDSRFIGKYEGNQAERDRAYHQGTAWAWLMGPFITSFVRVYNDRERALELLEPLMTAHLQEAGIETISEIFDAVYPFTPRGCISQAWSVAEVLRCYYEDIKGEK